MSSEFLQVCGIAAFAFVHAAITRGLRGAVLFGGIALATALAGEYAAVNLARQVRHHATPQIVRVPLAALLSWYAIAYGALDTAEAIVESRQVPVAAALVATSLDLLLDVYGLARGMWEWRGNGAYATEIAGPNGKQGVPLMNFATWLLMIGGIVAVYRRLEPRRRSRGMGGLILLAYFTRSAFWAVRARRPRYAALAGGVPVAVSIGLIRGIRRPPRS